MAHICDYIIKGKRPKKPIIVLYGPSSDFLTFFKKSTDVASPVSHVGTLCAHAFTEPLFTESSTLWVEAVPNFSDLRQLCSKPIIQPIIFNTPEGTKEPELSPEWAKLVQLVSKGVLQPGGKPHKDFMMWFLSREFSFKANVFTGLIEYTSPMFGDDFLRSADNLAKLLYLFHDTTFNSVDSVLKGLKSIPPDTISKILNPKKEPQISGVVDSFFITSHRVYDFLQEYTKIYDSPLPLLKSMVDTTKTYLNCAYAIRMAKGTQQPPLSLAQGLKVYRDDFSKYQTSVSKFFNDNILWNLAKDLCIIQSRYRCGEKSQVPLYNLVIRYIGVGL